MKDFLLAVSFLTILPVLRSAEAEEKRLARSMAFFPLVGLVIGALLVPGYYVFSYFFTGALATWLTIGLLVLLTGALHLDGLADTIDGLASRGTREKILEVMKDSHIGAFGVIGLILVMGAKYLAMGRISYSSSFPYALMLMTVTGRNAMVLVCYRSAYARPSGGLAKPFAESLGAREVLLSSGLTIVISFVLMGMKGFLVFLGVGLFSLGYRLFFGRKLGGVTGDILGAGNELGELLCLLLLIILGTGTGGN